MNGRVMTVDFPRLELDGFAILPGLIQGPELARFEQDIARVGDALAAQRGIPRTSGETIADVLRQAGRHRAMLFDHIKRLFSLARVSVEIGAALEEAGLFRHGGIEVPIVWPTLRADLPGEATYFLPLHQDYATTRCRTAYRLWIPLRDADRHFGSMDVAPGSHRQGPYQYEHEGAASLSIERDELTRRGLKTETLELPAGDGVLFNPWLVHGSVANQSPRTKWVLLLHVQDLATFVNPDEPRDPVYAFLGLSERSRAGSSAGAKQ
jgi:hypothetical protein